MLKKYKSFLFLFDLIGPSPQLLIFNNTRYKSTFSSLLSIFIFIFSIFFSLFSLKEYLKFDSPIISYYKDNDETTIRNFKIKNKLLLFQLITTSTLNVINDSIAYYKAEYAIIYINGASESIPLEIEKCQIGKNLDSSYNDIVYKLNDFGKPLEEFYCLNFHNNMSLFYDPNIGFSFINLYVILKNNNNFPPENIQSFIVTENNVLAHDNKDNPINQSFIYQFTTGYSSLDYTTINYDFQYIKYESDNGPFYKRIESFNGMSFSGMSFYRNNDINGYDLKKNIELISSSMIGTITFQINKSNFDCYKRSYQRIQSLLAEVMSVVNLLLEIVRFISYILFNKKISKDIIKELIKRSVNDNLNKTRNNINNILIKKPLSSSERSNIKLKIIENPISNSDYLEEKRDKLKYANILPKIKKNNKLDIYNRILKNLNYYNFIKSYFCFKDNKSKLINLCHKIITEDMCIERILERLYNLENLKHHFPKIEKENSNFLENIRLNEIKKYIYKIDHEEKKNHYKDDNNKSKEEKKQNK